MSGLKVYIIKFQVVNYQQPSFEFIGWPEQWAVVMAESKNEASFTLGLKVGASKDGNATGIRIITALEADEPVTVLPIKIEQNTCIDNKAYIEELEGEEEKKSKFEKEYFGPLWTSQR